MIVGWGVSQWRVIADELHGRISRGEWPAGGRFLSEKEIQDEFGVARSTARRVMDLLQRWGLIVIEQGRPTRVSQTGPMKYVDIPPGHEVGARPALAEDAIEWGIPDGAPMLVLIEQATGREVGAWPADRTRLRQQSH